MDPRNYYHKIRETVRSLNEDFFVVVSKETADGGRAGVLTEVSRYQAAKLLVEERALMATAEQTAKYHTDNEQRLREARALAEASQFQLVKMADAVIRAAEPMRQTNLNKSKE